MTNKIVIVGGIPEPIGGVTNFVHRLVSNNGSSIAAVIDMYDTKNKVELNNYDGDYHIIPKGFFRVFVLAAVLNKYKNNTIFFNFSRAYAFVLLMLLPKPENCTWVLMLHHGNLHVTNKVIEYVFKLIFIFTRRKIDRVLALSEEQYRFYQKYSFKNIKHTTSYIPCTPPIDNPENIKDIVLNLRKKGMKILIASGFPRKIYNHSWIIDFSKKHRTALLLFLYGEGECMQDLSKTCDEVDNCFLFYGYSESSFNYALSLSDIYVRPNDVDSFGIACADAITLGIKVLASNVCERYHGCETYHHELGKEDFAEKLTELLSNWSSIQSSREGLRCHFNLALLQ